MRGQDGAGLPWNSIVSRHLCDITNDAARCFRASTSRATSKAKLSVRGARGSIWKLSIISPDCTPPYGDDCYPGQPPPPQLGYAAGHASRRVLGGGHLIVHRRSGGTLGLSYHASFKGKNVPDGTFAKMATAFRNGNSIRFGLHHTGIAPSTSTKDRPFAAWSVRAAGGARQARSSPLVLYPFVARTLVDHPCLWATTTARARSADRFAALDGVFSGRRTTAEMFLKALYQANKDVADAYAAKVVGQAESSMSPLKATDACGSHAVKVKRCQEEPQRGPDLRRLLPMTMARTFLKAQYEMEVQSIESAED